MKKLHKVEQGKMLCGVCTGIAAYFDIDPTLVRLGWVLFSLLGGSGILAYIICALVIPNDPDKVQKRHQKHLGGVLFFRLTTYRQTGTIETSNKKEVIP